MRKIIYMILTALAVFLSLPFANITAKAADDMTFSFDLTVDGKDIKEVQTGDIITVVLKLKRTAIALFLTLRKKAVSSIPCTISWKSKSAGKCTQRTKFTWILLRIAS